MATWPPKAGPRRLSCSVCRTFGQISARAAAAPAARGGAAGPQCGGAPRGTFLGLGDSEVVGNRVKSLESFFGTWVAKQLANSQPCKVPCRTMVARLRMWISFPHFETPPCGSCGLGHDSPVSRGPSLSSELHLQSRGFPCLPVTLLLSLWIPNRAGAPDVWNSPSFSGSHAPKHAWSRSSAQTNPCPFSGVALPKDHLCLLPFLFFLFPGVLVLGLRETQPSLQNRGDTRTGERSEPWAPRSSSGASPRRRGTPRPRWRTSRLRDGRKGNKVLYMYIYI